MEAPVEDIPGALTAGVLFICDHASPALPEAYGSLGLAPAQFTRHIAYDIGAAALTRALAAEFAAPAVLTRFSRLLIDPNRGADDPTLVILAALSRRRARPARRHAGGRACAGHCLAAFLHAKLEGRRAALGGGGAVG